MIQKETCHELIFLIAFSISLTILITISFTDNDSNSKLKIEQYITFEKFNNQIKSEEDKYKALLNYTTILAEKIMTLEKHQGDLIFKIKRFQDDLKDVCDYTNDEGIQIFSCNYKDQF